MKFLLDLNVLLAWGWADHADHRRAASWIAGTKHAGKATLLTSAIPELGFVRVSIHRTGGRLSVAEAKDTLASMLRSLGKVHGFLPDDWSSSRDFPGWCHGSSQTTDAHLWLLARAHGVALATLDTGIPGAFVVPE